ncbi:MAG: DedA family protein [Dehalococcoidia bacterium]
MGFLAGLHGTVAAVLICSLLFADEAGLPIPIAPSEGLLLLVGVLISSDAFSPWLILPAVLLSMTVGMLTGYGWARTVGPRGLQAIARRVGAAAVYDRTQRRLQSASPWGIGFSRMLPGVRPYATLVSGAAAVDMRRFMLGALPALVLWEAGWVVAGMLVGLPIAHLLGRFEKLALRGVILVLLGTVIWFAIRDVSPERRGGVMRLAPRLRASFALAFDAGTVASVVGGIFAIGREVLEASANGWLELLVAAVVLILLLVVARRIQTPGERLFETDYWHHHPEASLP